MRSHRIVLSVHPSGAATGGIDTPATSDSPARRPVAAASGSRISSTGASIRTSREAPIVTIVNLVNSSQFRAGFRDGDHDAWWSSGKQAPSSPRGHAARWTSRHPSFKKVGHLIRWRRRRAAGHRRFARLLVCRRGHPVVAEFATMDPSRRLHLLLAVLGTNLGTEQGNRCEQAPRCETGWTAERR
jgi:hypothetical protein